MKDTIQFSVLFALVTDTPGAVVSSGTAPNKWYAGGDGVADQTVMEYLLSPISKAFHEAGRER